MALITCKKCGHSISDKAEICPKCSAPTNDLIVEKDIDASEKSDQALESDVFVSEPENLPDESKKPMKRINYIIGAMYVICFALMILAVTCDHLKSDYATETTQKDLDSRYFSNEFESSQIDRGWEYLKMEVIKRPGSAELVGYAGPDDSRCKSIEKDVDMPGLSVVSYQVKAKNGYGIVDEETLVVFFINGEPILGDTADNFMKESASSIRALIKFAQALKK